MNAERPSEATVEALAKVLWLSDGYDLDADPSSRTAAEMRPEFERQARVILASDWLAAHDAQVRADRDREWRVAIEGLARDLDAVRMFATADAIRNIASGVAGEGQEGEK